MSQPTPSLALPPGKSWRQDAARIVEELFSVTPAHAWDMLLDLRQSLLKGSDWNHTLDVFLRCREALEAEHYLPFYRLRSLLTGSLRLEAGHDEAPVSGLRQLLRHPHRSLADIRRQVEREVFEHNLEVSSHRLDFRVVEV